MKRMAYLTILLGLALLLISGLYLLINIKAALAGVGGGIALMIVGAMLAAARKR
jgi:thiosulfate reductase cytochrome b subunit